MKSKSENPAALGLDQLLHSENLNSWNIGLGQLPLGLHRRKLASGKFKGSNEAPRFSFVEKECARPSRLLVNVTQDRNNPGQGRRHRADQRFSGGYGCSECGCKLGRVSRRRLGFQVGSMGTRAANSP